MPPEEKNTTDAQIPNPENKDELIDNPDFVKPDETKEPKEAPIAAAEELDLTPAKAEPTAVGKTGNDNIDAVGSLLGDKGVEDADAIIASFAKTGEVTLADQAKIIEALGETVGAMAVTQLTNEANKMKEASTAARTEVLDYANQKFNGEDADTTWGQIQEYVKQSSEFSPADRAAMTKMLKKGGLQAQLVIDKIANVYAADSNTTTPADLLQGDTLTGGKFEPLSQQEYTQAVSKATNEFGYDSPQVRELQQRRMRSRQQGI